MKKLALLASVAALTVASVESADARHRRGHGSDRGAAVAAGLIGGALLGGLITAAATPSYAYPGYGYYPTSYPAYGYRYGHSYPVSYGYDYDYPTYSYPAYGYYSAPVTRVVYQPAPVYRTQVVYREPRVVNRVVYREPRYRTQVVYRDRDRYRGRVVRVIRRDVGATGAIRYRDDWEGRQMRGIVGSSR